MPVEVRWYTDPACPRSWAAEPELRKLMWELGDELRFRWVMGGLAREFGPGYVDDESGAGSGADPVSDLIADWLAVSAESGMPIDPLLWRESPIASTYPACQAVKAAGDQGPEREYAYLRRLREGLMLERRKLDHTEALVGVAGAAGLDAERFRVDLSSHASTEAFASDLDQARAVPDAAREAGGARRTEGRERIAFPSAIFVGEDDSRQEVWGRHGYDAYRGAAEAAGASAPTSPPAGELEVVERFGRVATREVEVLTGKPRPVVEAELWSLAREWRIRAVPVLTGTMWERA